MKQILVTLTICMIYSMYPALGEKPRVEYMKWSLLKDTNCDYTGYVPGGNKVSVERIIAPNAKLEENVFAGLAGNLGKASTAAMHLTNLVKGLGALTEVAPKLAPALGIIGAGFSMVKGFTDPKPQDVLDAANKAIAKLAEEVNDRLDEMKGYIDQKVISLEKDLVARKYDSLFRFWGNCLKEQTKAKVDECQEDAVKDIMAARPQFALFSSNVQAGDLNMDTYDVKRIEASLLTFRDYVILNFAALSALTATYQNDPSRAGDYRRYAADLDNEIDWSVKYVQNAVSIILYMHTNGDNCEDTMTFTPIEEVKESFLKIHTADWLHATCLIDRADVESRTCGYDLIARYDRKKPAGYELVYIEADTYENAMRYKSKELVKAKAASYKEAMKQTIETYWANELLDLVPSWKELKMNVAKDTLSEDQAMETRKVHRYSDDYRRRLLASIKSENV